MADKQYDVSPEMQRLFHLKQKQRSEAKSYFQKILANPHRPIEEAPPFDPVLFRFQAWTHYSSDYFRPNVRTAMQALGFTIFPIVFLFGAISWERKARDEKISSGEVAYKDRLFKFLR